MNDYESASLTTPLRAVANESPENIFCITIIIERYAYAVS